MRTYTERLEAAHLTKDEIAEADLEALADRIIAFIRNYEDEEGLELFSPQILELADCIGRLRPEVERLDLATMLETRQTRSEERSYFLDLVIRELRKTIADFLEAHLQAQEDLAQAREEAEKALEDLRHCLQYGVEVETIKELILGVIRQEKEFTETLKHLFAILGEAWDSKRIDALLGALVQLDVDEFKIDSPEYWALNTAEIVMAAYQKAGGGRRWVKEKKSI